MSDDIKIKASLKQSNCYCDKYLIILPNNVNVVKTNQISIAQPQIPAD